MSKSQRLVFTQTVIESDVKPSEKEYSVIKEIDWLVHRARAMGIVITVDLVPQQPLRMGAYDTAIHVRRARKGAN